MAAVLIGHEGGVTGISYDADGRRAATISRDGTARVWDARAEHELVLVARHPPGPTGAVPDPAGATVLSWGRDGASLSAVRAPRRTRALATEGAVVDAEWAPSGGRLVTVGPGGAFVHGADGRRLETLDQPAPAVDVAFAPATIVTGARDGSVRVFGAGSAPRVELELGAPVTRVAAARAAVAAATERGEIVVRAAGRAVRIEGHEGRVNALRFSPDGTRMASGGDDGAVRVWDRDGRRLLELDGHVGGASDVVFSPDGRSLVTTDRGRQVRVWDAGSGVLRRDLIGHFAPVNSAAFSRDGRWLVTTSALAAALWRSGTTSPYAYLRGHVVPVVRTASFTTDGHGIVSAGDDGTVRLYRCEACGGIDDLVALARRRLANARVTR